MNFARGNGASAFRTPASLHQIHPHNPQEPAVFKDFAAEALGLSDIGVIVPPSDYNKVEADDYLFHEDCVRLPPGSTPCIARA